MDPVLENVLVEMLVDLPTDIDIPMVAGAPESTWVWSDLHLSDPSVLLGWGRPFRSVDEMNRHLLRIRSGAQRPERARDARPSRTARRSFHHPGWSLLLRAR